MRRHWWRFALTALFLGAGLPTVVAGPVAAEPSAPALMTFVCPPGSSPEVCSAVATIEVTLKALELISPGLAPAWLVGIMDELTVTAPLPDYEAKFEEILTQVCGGGSTAPGCLEWEGRDDAIAQRIKEAAKDAALLAELCESGFSWSWVCPDPEAPEADPAQDPSPVWAYPEGNTHEYLGPVAQAAAWGHQATTSEFPWLTFFLTKVDATYWSGTNYVPLFRWTNDGNGRWSEVSIRVNRNGAGGAMSTLDLQLWCNGSSVQSVTRSVAFTEYQTISWFVGRFTGASAGQAMGLHVGGTNATNSGTLFSCGGSGVDGTFYFSAGGSGASTVTVPAAGASTQVQVYQEMTGPSLAESLSKLALVLPTMDPEYEVAPPATVPPRPGTEELPTPTTEATPSTTTIPPTPPTIVPAANPTGTHEERQTGLLENLVSGVASGFNYLGNLVGGLLRSVIDMIRWLGDIFGYWIRWLWERLGALLRSIRDAINSLGDLFEWMLQQVINGIASLGGGLWSLLQAIWNLPELIWQKFLAGLQLLFVPTDLPAGPVCADTFPCNWIEEANGTIGELKAGIDGAGGCVAPSVGWSQFSASFPPPPGCSGGNGVSQDAAAGDLFGWRSTIRTILALSLWVGFFAKLLQMAPWSRPGDMPLGEGQVTV